MKRKLLLVLPVLAALSFSTHKKISLSFNLQVGKMYEIESVADQVIMQSISGQKLQLLQQFSFTYAMDVKQRDTNGNLDMSVTYRRIRFIQDNPIQGKVSYDSDRSDNEVNAIAKPFAALKGCSFTMQVSPLGQVNKVGGIANMIDSMMVRMGTEENKKAMMREAFVKQFNEDALKESMEQSLRFYPKKPVKVGGEWIQSIATRMTIPMLIKSKYKLERVANGIAYIKMKGQVSPNELASLQTDAGLTNQYELSGSQTGDIEVEITTGRIMRSVLQQNLVGNFTISGAQMKEPMMIPMSIKSTIVSEMK
ncbi:MAG: hypothetical protein EXR21_04355 [Flavobacteriaceae bacterium]|nr:hypothetical protein [Flavobacteriaceae bacterium]